MNHPIKLTIEERAPGSYVWTLLETDDAGEHPRVLRSADDPVDSYELSLASGKRALESTIRERAPRTA